MKKLYMIGIGGGIDKTDIEVNDLKFIVADSIEDTYEILKKDWPGSSLHIDEYMIVDHVDGYKINILNEPQKSDVRLFFINMGGSLKGHFGEVHEYGLFLSDTLENAELRGEEELLLNCYDRHIDDIFEVQDRLKTADGKDVFISFATEKNDDMENNYFNGYVVLKK